MWPLWEDVIFICDWNVSAFSSTYSSSQTEKSSGWFFPPLVYIVKWTPKILHYLYGIITILLDKSHHTLSSSALHLVDSYAGVKGLRLANSWLLTLWCNYRSLLPPFWLSEIIAKTKTYRSVRRWLRKSFFFFFFFFSFPIPLRSGRDRNAQVFPSSLVSLSETHCMEH